MVQHVTQRTLGHHSLNPMPIYESKYSDSPDLKISPSPQHLRQYLHLYTRVIYSTRSLALTILLKTTTAMQIQFFALMLACALLLLAKTASSQPPSTLLPSTPNPTTDLENTYNCTQKANSTEPHCEPGSSYNSIKKGGTSGGSSSGGGRGSGRDRTPSLPITGTAGQRPASLASLVGLCALVLGCGWFAMA